MKTIKVVSAKEFHRVERIALEALRLASKHDPDLLRDIRDCGHKIEKLADAFGKFPCDPDLSREIGVRGRRLERLAEDIGVPLHEYRCVAKGKPVRRKR